MAFIGPGLVEDSVQLGKKGLSPVSLDSESFITLSRQEEACGEINFTSRAAKSIHVFQGWEQSQ